MLPLLMASSEGFLITRVDPGSVAVKPGDSVSLLCVVDSAYEFCKWINPQQQECDFEWKRAKGNITTQDCHGAFSEKVVFHGKYDDKECGITIASATAQDQGTWRCEVEEYVFLGSRGSGSLETAEIQVRVQNPTTVQPTTPSTTTRTSTLPHVATSTAEKATTQRVPTTTTTKTTTTTRTTTKETTSSRLPDPQPKSSLAPNSASEDPEASPSVQEDRETGGSSAGVVGGVLLALVIAVAAVFGVFYYRRRKERVPIVNYATAADNANTGITIHSDRDENTNYHEYFPPNMTYSTSTPQSDA
jgi:hypothetical protein